MPIDDIFGNFVIVKTTQDHPKYDKLKKYYSGRMIVMKDDDGDKDKYLELGGWSDLIVIYGNIEGELGLDTSPNKDNSILKISHENISKIYPINPAALVEGTIYPLGKLSDYSDF